MILRIMHMKRMTMLKMEVETEGGKKGEGERRGGREKERKKEGRQEETGSQVKRDVIEQMKGE